MKILAFTIRNTKEILRDKINIMFGLGFPIIILVLLSFVQKNVPAPMFELEQLTPGIIVFGFSFFSLFSGMLIAKDRTSSLFIATVHLASKSIPFHYFILYSLYSIGHAPSRDHVHRSNISGTGFQRSYLRNLAYFDPCCGSVPFFGYAFRNDPE